MRCMLRPIATLLWWSQQAPPYTWSHIAPHDLLYGAITVASQSTCWDTAMQHDLAMSAIFVYIRTRLTMPRMSRATTRLCACACMRLTLLRWAGGAGGPALPPVLRPGAPSGV